MILLKVHLTPEIFFRSNKSSYCLDRFFEKFFDLVKTSNFYDLLNLTKIGSRPRKERSGMSRVVT